MNGWQGMVGQDQYLRCLGAHHYLTPSQSIAVNAVLAMLYDDVPTNNQYRLLTAISYPSGTGLALAGTRNLSLRMWASAPEEHAAPLRW